MKFSKMEASMRIEQIFKDLGVTDPDIIKLSKLVAHEMVDHIPCILTRILEKERDQNGDDNLTSIVNLFNSEQTIVFYSAWCILAETYGMHGDLVRPGSSLEDAPRDSKL